MQSNTNKTPHAAEHLHVSFLETELTGVCEVNVGWDATKREVHIPIVVTIGILRKCCHHVPTAGSVFFISENNTE